MSSARDFLFKASVPEREISVGGEVVTVRGLTTRGKDELQEAAMNGQGFRAAILRATCYLNGKPLFKADDDVGNIPSHLTEDLVNAAIELAAMTAAEVDELEKN